MADNKAKKRTLMDEEERKFYENLGSRLRNYINHYNISLEYVKKIMKVHRIFILSMSMKVILQHHF